jgi:hypothetical protein
MRHPSDGTLRRLLDEPAGVADADREHIAGCPRCRSELAAAQQDAAAVGAALDAQHTADVDAGWQRLSHAVAVEAPRRVTVAAPTRRWWAARRSPVVAGFAVAALLAGGSAAAATDWLQIFRTEQVAPVTAPEADLIQLPDLSDFGEVEVIEPITVREVADAAEAERATGLTLPRLGELPQGVTGAPTYLVGARTSAVFTFSFAKATQFAAAAGKTLPPPPAGLDGSQFRLAAGPGVAAVWAQNRPRPALIVARVFAPTADSSEVPFATARDYLLSLPVVPDNVASQLRAFSGDGTTLPLFLPVEEMTSSAADVNGLSATVLASRDGVMAAVVWVEHGVVTAVAGSLSADEVLAVARGLRWGP